MKQSDLIDRIIVETDLVQTEKFKVIEELLDVAVKAGKIHDRQRALQDLFERERYLSTGFENGLAVPHAKSLAVSEMVLVFGLYREGIDFDSLDGKPTHFVFLLLSPVDVSGPHIQTLALLARNFQTAEIAEELLSAPDKTSIISVLQKLK